jgi:hypothetical protein
MNTIRPIVRASIPIVPKNSTIEILLSGLKACSSTIRKGQGFDDDCLPVIRAGIINDVIFTGQGFPLVTI